MYLGRSYIQTKLIRLNTVHSVVFVFDVPAMSNNSLESRSFLFPSLISFVHSVLINLLLATLRTRLPTWLRGIATCQCRRGKRQVRKIPLEGEMAAHSSILTWEIPEMPSELQPWGPKEWNVTGRLSKRKPTHPKNQ